MHISAWLVGVYQGSCFFIYNSTINILVTSDNCWLQLFTQWHSAPAPSIILAGSTLVTETTMTVALTNGGGIRQMHQNSKE